MTPLHDHLAAVPVEDDALSGGDALAEVVQSEHGRNAKCLGEDRRVHNRLEDYVRDHAKKNGMPDFERIRVLPMDKTTQEIGNLSQSVREGMSYSPDEAAQKAHRVRSLVAECQKPDHGEALELEALRHGVRLAYHDSIAAGWPRPSRSSAPPDRPTTRGSPTSCSAARTWRPPTCPRPTV